MMMMMAVSSVNQDEILKKKRNEKKETILTVLSILSAGVLLISNLCATKIFSLGGIPFDGGIILFPLSYIVADLLMEIFHKKTADLVALASFGLSALAAGAFYVVGILPPYPGWDGQEAYQTILGFAPRVMVGSLAAYLASVLVNNLIFAKIRQAQNDNSHFYVRALGSSVFSHLIDAVVFEMIAFYGVLPLKDFVTQAVFAYATGLILEIVLFPITALVAKLAKK